MATNVEDLKTPENKKINFIEEYNSENCLKNIAKKTGVKTLKFEQNDRTFSQNRSELHFTLNPLTANQSITRTKSYNNIAYNSNNNKLPLINQNVIINNTNNKYKIINNNEL
jgi:hypothetical protein